MKILFVCLGNICRSPMAETVFKAKVKAAGLSADFEIDSAGTAAYHEGEQADARMRQHAQQRGYNITSIARQVRTTDFEHFDKIIGMDNSNMENLKRICPPAHIHKLHKMTDFSQHIVYDNVPDPYYGGAAGFELVIDLLEDAGEGLLKRLT